MAIWKTIIEYDFTDDQTGKIISKRRKFYVEAPTAVGARKKIGAWFLSNYTATITIQEFRLDISEDEEDVRINE